MKVIGKSEKGYILEAPIEDLVLLTGDRYLTDEVKFGDYINIFELIWKFETTSAWVENINKIDKIAEKIVNKYIKEQL